MRRRWCLAALVLCLAPHVCTAAQPPEEDEGVLVLDEKNFEETIKANPFILVMFYAPWCGHCKQFAPEYVAAAGQLKQAKPPIPLAKVDATAETKLAEEYGVRGYPTIKLFIDARDQEYTGGRTEQSVVTWVLKKSGPPSMLLEDVASAEQFEKDNSLAVLGFFGTAHEEQRAAFDAAARQVEDVMFAHSLSDNVITKYGITAPAIRMVFPHDEKVMTFSGDMKNTAEIEAFVKAYRHPLISVFNGDIAPELFGDGRPIVFLFRDNDAKGKAAEEELRKAAPNFGRRQLVSVAGSSEPMDQRLMDYVSVDPEELPTIRIVENPTGSLTKYRLEGDVTAASLTAFLQDFESRKLRPHLKSEAVPTTQLGPVYTLVGSTFDSLVKDTTKDVLVEFYAPWCGHCKKLEPVYRDVARTLEGVKSVLIAKMDATANDVLGVDVEGFPTIKFWRANNKDDPLDYDGDRDVESFISWIEEKASLPFSRDELRTEL